MFAFTLTQICSNTIFSILIPIPKPKSAQWQMSSTGPIPYAIKIAKQQFLLVLHKLHHPYPHFSPLASCLFQHWFQSSYGSCQSYVTDMLTPYETTRHLRSSDEAFPVVHLLFHLQYFDSYHMSFYFLLSYYYFHSITVLYCFNCFHMFFYLSNVLFCSCDVFFVCVLPLLVQALSVILPVLLPLYPLLICKPFCISLFTSVCFACQSTL